MKEIKLDRPKVKHSVASKDNDRIWFYEELEGEILDFAFYMKKHYNIKYNDTARAHLKRIGKSINNMKVVSSLGFGNLEDLHNYDMPKTKTKPLDMMTKPASDKEYKVTKQKNTYTKRTDEYLKKLAKDTYFGKVFTSLQVNEQDHSLLSQIFLPMALMNPSQAKGAYKNKPAMYYGEISERTTLPTGPNGYPMFTACSFLNQKDTEKFKKYLNKIEKAVDEI